MRIHGNNSTRYGNAQTNADQQNDCISQYVLSMRLRCLVKYFRYRFTDIGELPIHGL